MNFDLNAAILQHLLQKKQNCRKIDPLFADPGEKKQLELIHTEKYPNLSGTQNFAKELFLRKNIDFCTQNTVLSESFSSENFTGSQFLFL